MDDRNIGITITPPLRIVAPAQAMSPPLRPQAISPPPSVHLVDNLPQELASLKQQHAALTEQYNAAVREINGLRQTVQRVVCERDVYAREMQHALQGRLTVTQDYAQVVEDRNQLRSEYQAVMSERDTVHREIDSLAEQLRAAQRTIEQLRADRERVASEKNRVENERCQFESDRNQFEAARAQSESERRKLVSELNRLGTLVQDRAHESSNLEEERKKLASELEAACARLSLLEDQLNVAQAERDVAQRERVEAIEHRETILSETYNRARLDAADRNARELDAIRCDLEATRRELESLRRSDAASRQELAGALRELDAAQQQRDFAFKQRDQAVAERESMRLLSDRIRTERDEFVSKLAIALRESDELRRANRDLQRRINVTGAQQTDSFNDPSQSANPIGHVIPVSASHDSAIDTSQTSQFGGEPVYFASSASASAQSSAPVFDTEGDPPTLKASRSVTSQIAGGQRGVPIATRSRPTTPVMPKWLFAAKASSCSSPDANAAHYAASLAASTSSNSVGEAVAAVVSKSSKANVSSSNANNSINSNKQPAKLSAILDQARDHVISKLGKYRRVRKETTSTDAGGSAAANATATANANANSNTNTNASVKEHTSTSRLNSVFTRRKEKDRTGKKLHSHSDSHLSLASSCSSSLHDATMRDNNVSPAGQLERDALRQLDSVLNNLQPTGTSCHPQVQQQSSSNAVSGRFSAPNESLASFATGSYSRAAPTGSTSLSGGSNGERSLSTNANRPHSLNSPGNDVHNVSCTGSGSTTNNSNSNGNANGNGNGNGTGTWPKRCSVVPLAFSLSPTHAGEIVFEYSAAPSQATQAQHDEALCCNVRQPESTTKTVNVVSPTDGDPEATLRRVEAQRTEHAPIPPKCTVSPRRPPLSEAAWFSPTRSSNEAGKRRPRSAYFEFESQSLLSNSNGNTQRQSAADSSSRGSSLRRYTIVIEAVQSDQPNVVALGMRIHCAPDGSVFVAAVAPGSRAERANVCVGDELVEANRTPLRGVPHAHVTQLLKQSGASDLRLVVMRHRFASSADDDVHEDDGSRSASVSITPTASRQASVRTSLAAQGTTFHRSLGIAGQRAAPDFAAARVVKLERRGQSLGVALVGGNASGIFVNEVRPGSIAALGGVRVGDQILEYNGLSMRPAHECDDRLSGITGEMALRELQKPVERCTMLLQYVGGRRFEELRAANTGDYFFVRARFDHDAAAEGELTFHCGNVLLIDSTLWNVSLGQWHAHTLDDFGMRLEHGAIPSPARTEEEWRNLQAQFPHLASASGGLYETVSGASTVSSQHGAGSQRHNNGMSDSLRKTFRRRSFNQPTPSRSVTSVAGVATAAGSHSPPEDASPSTSQQPGGSRPFGGPPQSALAELVPYVRVERYDDVRSRPICIIGPLHRTVIRKLTTEHADRFITVDFEPTGHNAALLEREIEEGTVVDFRPLLRQSASRRRMDYGYDYDSDPEVESVDCNEQDEGGEDNFESLPLQKLLDRLERPRGAPPRTVLLDLSPMAIDRLVNKHRLHPIIIFIKHKSYKQIREVKDIHYMPEQVSRPRAQALFEKAQRLEREHSKLFTCTIPGGNLAFMCTQVKFAIENEQRKPIWVAARPDCSNGGGGCCSINSAHATAPASMVQSAELCGHFAYAGKASTTNQQMGMISTSMPVDV